MVANGSSVHSLDSLPCARPFCVDNYNASAVSIDNYEGRSYPRVLTLESLLGSWCNVCLSFSCQCPGHLVNKNVCVDNVYSNYKSNLSDHDCAFTGPGLDFVKSDSNCPHSECVKIVYDSSNTPIEHPVKLYPSEPVVEFESKVASSLIASERIGYNYLDKIVANVVPVNWGLPRGIVLKESTKCFMRSDSVCKFDISQCVRIYFYIDGGYHPDDEVHSTWGICCIGENSKGKQTVIFTVGGEFDYEASGTPYLGECFPPGSFPSELYAQIMTRIIIFQYGKLLSGPPPCCPSV